MRVYSVSSAAVSVSADQDLVAIYSGAKAIKIHSVTIGQGTQTAVGNLPITLKRLTATVTSGSGGSAPGPALMNPGDAAATATAHANDTTQATTSGTSSQLAADYYNPINGYLYLPPAEDRPVIGPNSAFIVSLNGAPSATSATSCTVVFEELF
jgi:hypothetical protein